MLSRRKSQKNKKGHIIALGDQVWSKLAIFTAVTFLRFHKDYKVLIHCDSKNRDFLSKKIFIRKFNIELCPCISNSKDAMRYQVQFFGNLQGKGDILMDADNWWFAGLPASRTPMIYNVENSIRSKQLIKIAAVFLSENLNIRFSHLGELNMITACLSAWNGSKSRFTDNEMLQMYDFLNESPSFGSKLEIGEKRLIGQIIQSLVLSEMDFESLKQIEFVERKLILNSSFYGATGYRYGK